jgi:hypothetical protein
LVAVGGGTAIALAAAGNGPVPPHRPLAQAIRAALAAPKVDGLSASVSFTDNLIASSDIQGSDPLLTGAPRGRLWVSSDGHLRLELQGDNGDAQLVVNKTSWWISDPMTNTVYEGALPGGGQGERGLGNRAPDTHAGAEKLPTLAAIQAELSRLMADLNISGARPGDIGGQPSYTVSVSPRHNTGLLGSLQLAWDAVHGVPLRVAIYARGDSSPALELAITGISFGSVSPSVFEIQPPAGDHVVNLGRLGGVSASRKTHSHAAPLAGVSAVASRLPFTLDAPARLAGMARREVTLLHLGGHPAALLLYGQGLGALAVIEQPAGAGSAGRIAAPSGGSDGQGLTIPSVSINGASAQELATALGTVVRFTRGEVGFTVLGSVSRATANRAARGL